MEHSIELLAVPAIDWILAPFALHVRLDSSLPQEVQVVRFAPLALCLRLPVLVARHVPLVPLSMDLFVLSVQWDFHHRVRSPRALLVRSDRDPLVPAANVRFVRLVRFPMLPVPALA